MVETSEQSTDRLTPKAPVALVPGPAPAPAPPGTATLTLDPTVALQRIEGFGGAFTDSVASVFAKLGAPLQERVLELLWGPTGQRYNLARTTIGATDFSTTVYSYNDSPKDFAMVNFSIAHDLAEIVPLMQRAQQRAATASGGVGVDGSGLEFLATPWSPPAWMKANGEMRNSAQPGLVADPATHAAYALYLSSYVTALAAQGINVTRLTVQNEPHVKNQFLATYPCCGFAGQDERDFLRDFLGPRMRADHPHVRLFVHDDQKDIMVDRVQTIMSDARAASFVDGVAFHWCVFHALYSPSSRVGTVFIHSVPSLLHHLSCL